jgi:hypothetical protein
MSYALRHLLIAATLVLAQQAAQLHALAHVKHDLTKAEHGGQCVPPINHPAELCIAYHAVGSALPGVSLGIEAVKDTFAPLASVDLPVPFPPRIEFDSRAPPLVS